MAGIIGNSPSWAIAMSPVSRFRGVLVKGDGPGTILRFRRMRSLQKFAAVHSSVHNLFNRERQLSSRGIFKLSRSAALDEDGQERICRDYRTTATIEGRQQDL